MAASASPLAAAFRRTLSMHSLIRLLLPKFSSSSSSSSTLNHKIQRIPLSTTTKKPSPSSTGDHEWNDAWETAWLPDDPTATSSAADVTFPSSADVVTAASSPDIDADTKAFVAEMDEQWSERRAAARTSSNEKSKLKWKLEEEKRKDVDEYRLRKQRIYAGLWMKEIEKMEEQRSGGIQIRILLRWVMLSIGFLILARSEYVDMVKAGIIDPLKVLYSALVDAASVSLLLTTTEAAVVERAETQASSSPRRMPNLDDFGY